MKRTLLIIIACMSMLSSQAQTLIHYWHFNTMTSTKFYNPGIPTIKADYSVLDVNKTGLAYDLVPTAPSTYTGYIDDYATTAVDSDVYNLRTIASVVTPAGNAYRWRKPVDSAYLVFYIPSTGYKNLKFSYVVENSSTDKGFNTHNFSYSTDSGATWKTAGLDHLSDSTNSVGAFFASQPTFKLITLTFTSADTTVNNNPRLAIKITPTGNLTGASGNNRIDNVALDGTALSTAVATVTAANNAVTVYPNPAAASITINTAVAGEKNVTIYNIAGQVVYKATAGSQLVTVPVATLKSGLYYVLVHNAITGENNTAKFVKE